LHLARRQAQRSTMQCVSRARRIGEIARRRQVISAIAATFFQRARRNEFTPFPLDLGAYPKTLGDWLTLRPPVGCPLSVVCHVCSFRLKTEN
jgi:hypothetical protein